MKELYKENLIQLIESAHDKSISGRGYPLMGIVDLNTSINRNKVRLFLDPSDRLKDSDMRIEISREYKKSTPSINEAGVLFVRKAEDGVVEISFDGGSESIVAGNDQDIRQATLNFLCQSLNDCQKYSISGTIKTNEETLCLEPQLNTKIQTRAKKIFKRSNIKV